MTLTLKQQDQKKWLVGMYNPDGHIQLDGGLGMLHGEVGWLNNQDGFDGQDSKVELGERNGFGCQDGFDEKTVGQYQTKNLGCYQSVGYCIH